VSYVGAARAVRDPAGGLAAVLALVVGLTVGVLSTVLWATTQHGAEVAAEESVGADLRADGPAFTQAELDAVGALPGVTSVAGVSSLGRIAMTSEDGSSETVDVYVADLAALADIQSGFADGLDVPAEAIASGGDTVPVIASDDVGRAGFGASLNYTRTFDIRVVGTDSSVPGITRADRWLLIDQDVLNEGTGTNAGSRPRTLLVGVDGDAGRQTDPVAEVLPPQTQVKTQADAEREATGGAIGTGLRGAFTVAAAVGGALAAAAVIITMVIAAPARGRLFSQLRTLGLSSRQARGLATWELAPLAVTAILSGGLLGLAIPWLLLPSVDLRGLTGGTSQPGMSVDWTLVGGAVGSFVLVAVLAMSVAVATSRRLRLGTVLRVGEEV
ncbi:MAG TPA: ABC transporter permease, partial [Jiangellaceae bacterium]